MGSIDPVGTFGQSASATRPVRISARMPNISAPQVTHSGFFARAANRARRRRAMSQQMPQAAVASVMYSMMPTPISFMSSFRALVARHYKLARSR